MNGLFTACNLIYRWIYKTKKKNKKKSTGNHHFSRGKSELSPDRSLSGPSFGTLARASIPTNVLGFATLKMGTSYP